MSETDKPASSQIGGVNLSDLKDTELSARDISSSVQAGGHIAGRDVVIYNYYYQAQAEISAPTPGEAAPAEPIPDNPYRGLPSALSLRGRRGVESSVSAAGRIRGQGVVSALKALTKDRPACIVFFTIDRVGR